MTNPTLERAARAAVAAEQDQWDLPADEWDLETLERHGLIKIARAVLMAVRSNDLPSWAHFEQEAWRDGIDTILGEGD